MVYCDLLNLPDRLFKFYRYDSNLNEKRLLGEIFLATPFDFNDPCDCQRDVFNNSVAREKVKGKGWVCKKLQELGYNEKDSLLISNSLLKNDTYKYEVYKKQLATIGILCLTKNYSDTLMWGYYANNDGYCIEYNSKKIVHRIVIGYINKMDYATTLRLFQEDSYSTEPSERTSNLSKEELNAAQEFSEFDMKLISNTYLSELDDKCKVVNFIRNVYLKRISGRDIDYKVPPDGSPSYLFFDNNKAINVAKYYKKTIAWKHEQEFRIVVSFGGRLIINIGKDIIENIYIGCNMKNEKVIEIAYLISKLKLKVGLYKMNRLKNCGLQPVKINVHKCLNSVSDTDNYLNSMCKLFW